MYLNRHNAFCRFFSAIHSRAWNSNFGHLVALTASIHSESSDSEPDEAEFDEEKVLQYNFDRGFNYQEILLFLSERHEHPLKAHFHPRSFARRDHFSYMKNTPFSLKLWSRFYIFFNLPN